MNKEHLIIGFAIVIVLYLLYSKQQAASAAQRNAATTTTNNSTSDIISTIFGTISQLGPIATQSAATGDISDY